MSFGKVLIAVLFLAMFSIAWLSSSQGWWWYTMRSPSVMKEYQADNATYVNTYHTGAFRGNSTGLRSSSFSTTGTNRSFRSGSRGGRGK